MEGDGSIFWSGYTLDITPMKLNELELENTRYQLESILNSISEVVFSIEIPSGKLQFISSSVEKIFGRPLSDFEENSNVWIENIFEEDKWHVENNYKTTNGHDWTTIWLYPAAIAGAVLIAFIFSFKEKKEIEAA
jgi:PAS domain-containing protein